MQHQQEECKLYGSCNVQNAAEGSDVLARSQFSDGPFELFLVPEEGKTSIVAKKINCGLPSLFYCYANS